MCEANVNSLIISEEITSLDAKKNTFVTCAEGDKMCDKKVNVLFIRHFFTFLSNCFTWCHLLHM